jgi:hypothetical protein
MTEIPRMYRARSVKPSTLDPAPAGRLMGQAGLDCASTSSSVTLPPVTGRQAIAFVCEHGLVMQSARIPGIPTLVEAIAGEPISGSWWGHAKGRLIFRVLNHVYDSGDVKAFRLVEGKVALVHQRLWPALVRLADEIGHDRLATIDQEHTATGAHRAVETSFPRWVPADVARTARALDGEKARAMLPRAALAPTRRRGRTRKRKRTG